MCTFCLDGAYIADMHIESANFNWNEHMSALKNLATSPGITLYTGRRMFSSATGAAMCTQQFTQLSKTHDGVMEMVIFINISNSWLLNKSHYHAWSYLSSLC